MAELLSVPLKKSSDVDIVKPLKNIIQSTYNSESGTEDYTDALNELSRLRTNAIWKVFEKSSLEVIYSYYDQLVSLEKKIPPQEVQIPFKWKDAFDKGSIFGGRMSLTISSLAYERMCVLFNMAAMQSALAAQQPLDTEDSLKLAAKLFQQAAGIFSYLKANIMAAVHQETTPDLSPDALAALAQLMLAQAQEVIAYKCIRDEMKESMVAKVCAQCEELYTDALRALTRDALKPLWDRDWIPTVTAKQMAFRGLTHFYQSLVCRANKSVGEEIARLQFAVEQLRGAASVSRGGVLQEAATRAARHLAEATKDNDFIYHERVPDARALEPVPRAPVAKPQPPPERWADRKDLFASLVPLAVASKAREGAVRGGEQAAGELARLRAGAERLDGELAARGLPAAVEPCAERALPASVRAAAAAVRAAGGLPALRRLTAELPELLQRNREILDEAERMLNEEEEADEALRRQFGARWTRTASAKLTDAFRANAAKYRQIIDNAVRADNIVQEKLRQHQEVEHRSAERRRGRNRGGRAGRAGGQRRRRRRQRRGGRAARADARGGGTAGRARAAGGRAEGGAGRAARRAAGGAGRGGRRRGARLGAGRGAGPAAGAHGRLAAAAGGAAGARGGRARRAVGGAPARPAPPGGAGRARRRLRRLPRPHREPQRGDQVLQRPHAAAGGVPEQGVGLLLRAQDGEGGAAQGPDAGGVAARVRRRRAARRTQGGAAAAPAPHSRPRPRPRRRRRRRAALPHAAAGHAAAVRRAAVRVLRGAAAGRLQPLRHAALPAPRAAPAARASLPALPVPAAAAARRLPAAAARRVQPLRAAAVGRRGYVQLAT